MRLTIVGRISIVGPQERKRRPCCLGYVFTCLFVCLSSKALVNRKRWERELKKLELKKGILDGGKTDNGVLFYYCTHWTIND